MVKLGREAAINSLLHLFPGGLSMRRILAFAAGLFLAFSVHAELPVPWVSPGASIRETVGITDVEVVYHRPAVKGRKVWGGLVPYGEVWRLGANEATTIRFADAVKVA